LLLQHCDDDTELQLHSAGKIITSHPTSDHSFNQTILLLYEKKEKESKCDASFFFLQLLAVL